MFIRTSSIHAVTVAAAVTVAVTVAVAVTPSRSVYAILTDLPRWAEEC